MSEICIVIGGSSGTGKATVLLALSRGYRVNNFDLFPTETPPSQSCGIFVKCDVTNRNDEAVSFVSAAGPVSHSASVKYSRGAGDEPCRVLPLTSLMAAMSAWFVCRRARWKTGELSDGKRVKTEVYATTRALKFIVLVGEHLRRPAEIHDGETTSLNDAERHLQALINLTERGDMLGQVILLNRMKRGLVIAGFVMIKMFEHAPDREEVMTAPFSSMPDVIRLYRTTAEF